MINNKNLLTQEENFTLLCDFYELTMGNGYFQRNMEKQIAYFDVFFRKNPDGAGFSIFAGLQQIVEYIENLHFDADDMAYLRGLNTFDDNFLDYLENFKFSGDIYSVKEGTPIFPNEPVLTVKGNAIEAQLVETYLLLTINHQSLIATKANRIVRSADNRPIFEFGARRAQGRDGSVLGARAAYIGGCAGTSCTLTDKKYGVPATGTMAHSWVQMFDDEYTAFKTYCEVFPDNAILLIDTYNVIESGLPNAIKAFKEVLWPMGIKKCGVRLDSGDITYLSKKVRKILDKEGLTDCKIVASNSLDEYIIRDLLLQGAQVDSFGVGERLITSKSDPVFGGVYKLVAVDKGDGKVIPKIKISENVAKITNPHFKKLYRLYENETGKAFADLLCVYDEEVDDTKPIELFDPNYIWKRKTFKDFTAKELMQPIFINGEKVYECPHVEEIKKYCLEQIDLLWDEVKRFENPHNYYVDLSQKLWDIKNELLKEKR